MRQEVRRAPGLVMGSQGSHGLRLLGINPPYLTRAQLCLPGPPTDCNQSNCDLYMPATGNTSYGTQVGKVSVDTTSCNCWTSSTLAIKPQCEESIGSRLTLDQKKRTIQDWSKLSDCWSPRHWLLRLRALLPRAGLPTTAQAAILVAAR